MEYCIKYIHAYVDNWNKSLCNILPEISESIVLVPHTFVTGLMVIYA